MDSRRDGEARLWSTSPPLVAWFCSLRVMWLLRMGSSVPSGLFELTWESLLEV